MNFFKSKWLLLIIIPAVGWLVLSTIKINLQKNIVNKELETLETKISNLEESNSLLEKTISFLSHSSFLEIEARSKLNYKAPGEEVVFVYPDDSAVQVSSSGDFSRQLAQMPNPIKWIYYLLGY